MDVSNVLYDRYVTGVKNLLIGTTVRYYVETLGCQQNEADSEKIRAMAAAMGYLPAQSADVADLIVLNTCAIRRHAELRALSLIGTFKKIKDENPDTVIGVCGCMAAENHIVETLKKSYPYVSFSLEPNMLHLFPQLVFFALMEKRRVFVFGEDKGEITTDGIEAVRMQKHRAWVSIMYGCNNFCSYCIVPYVRGRERSRDSAAVLKECRELVAGGCKEITLLGQNVNSYRADVSFAELISKVAEIPGDFIIRFMTSHPKDVSDELIAAMKTYYPKIAPCFHLPLQSGSNRVLKAMNRTYTREKYLETVKKLRAAVPDIALTTDIIVGFPNETDEEFEETYSLVKEVGYDSIYSFIFSPREGTRAALMEDTVSEETKNKRMARLLELAHSQSYEKYAPYVGKEVRILVDSDAREGEDYYLGRTRDNKLVRFQSNENRIGEFVTVKIEKASPFDLIGTAL